MSTLFAMAAFIIGNVIELRFVADTLGTELDYYIQQAHPEPGTAPLASSTQYYVTPLGTTVGLPPYLRRLTPGIHEIYHGDYEYHIVIKDHDGRRFYLVYDATQVEHWEAMLHGMLIIGVVSSTLLGLGLGIWLSRRMVAPVIRLANDINRVGVGSEGDALPGGYGEDEVGHLAQAFDQFCRRIGAFVRREQEFTADVSHELRTSLAVIQSTVELLRARPNSERDLGAPLGRLERGVRHMNELIDVFLILAREPQPSEGETAEHHPVEPVMREVIESRQDEVSRRGLAVDVSVRCATEVQAPRPVIRAIINNLLGNAIAYTREGRITVTLAEHRVTVEDTGPRIPQSEHERIFQRAYQGNRSDTEGAGLGLHIVKRLCARYGWGIELESAEGRGTKVHVSFSP